MSNGITAFFSSTTETSNNTTSQVTAGPSSRKPTFLQTTPPPTSSAPSTYNPTSRIPSAEEENQSVMLSVTGLNITEVFSFALLLVQVSCALLSLPPALGLKGFDLELTVDFF